MTPWWGLCFPDLNHLPKVPPPHTIALGVRAAPVNLGAINIQSITFHYALPPTRVLLAGKYMQSIPTAPEVLPYPSFNLKVFTEVSPESGAGEALGVRRQETEFPSLCEPGRSTSYAFPKHSTAVGQARDRHARPIAELRRKKQMRAPKHVHHPEGKTTRPES